MPNAQKGLKLLNNIIFGTCSVIQRHLHYSVVMGEPLQAPKLSVWAGIDWSTVCDKIAPFGNFALMLLFESV